MNPITSPLITVEQLQRAIPGFKWDGGPSGRVLRAGWAKKLEQMWDKFLQDNPKLFTGYNGYDFSKEAYAVPLHARLYDSNDQRVWLEIDVKSACVTQITLVGLPEEGVEDAPSNTLEDYKEIQLDLTFGVHAAAKAFNLNGRFELFHHLIDEYSDREAVKLLSDFLYDHKVKIELEQDNGDDDDE